MRDPPGFRLTSPTREAVKVIETDGESVPEDVGPRVFDLHSMPVYPLVQRERNVFYQTENAKARLIELPPGGELPTCVMKEDVLFVVLSGRVNISVGSETHTLAQGQCLVSGPGTFSMTADTPVRLLGVQIKPR